MMMVGARESQQARQATAAAVVAEEPTNEAMVPSVYALADIIQGLLQARVSCDMRQGLKRAEVSCGIRQGLQQARVSRDATSSFDTSTRRGDAVDVVGRRHDVIYVVTISSC